MNVYETAQKGSRRRRAQRLLPLLLQGIFAIAVAVATTPVHAGNPIQLENERPGTTTWQLTNPALNREIEGYASLTSVNRGDPITLFINTSEPWYTIDIYRMGWYHGAGARLVRGGIRLPGEQQPTPVPDPITGLIECRWNPSYVLTTTNPEDPTDWRSGVYLAKLTAGVSGKQSYIIFVVREDDRASDYLFQSSVTTYQAYNNWGGKSLYDFNSREGAARKVSFNRPYAPGSHPLAASGAGAGDFLTTNAIPADSRISPAGWEYNMVRWLEREGYDVTYSTNIDTHENPRLLWSHKAWLSVGHDEYWTWEMRANIEQALSHGVSLGFFSANTCYWQIRLEPSPVTGEPNRTMVAYKDVALREDPYAHDLDFVNDRLITTLWRNPPISRPEESLLGVMYETNPVDGDIEIMTDRHWALAGTGLHVHDHLVGLLGYEVDRRFGLGPPGTEVIAHSPYKNGPTQSYADMITYVHPSGATVFAAGTIQWSWGLDDFNVPRLRSSRLSQAALQITRNILARLAGDQFPVARLTASTATAGARIRLSSAGSFDPDGTIVSYRWDFGDGKIAQGPASEHVYESAGQYAVTLTVIDNKGAAASTSMMVTVRR